MVPALRISGLLFLLFWLQACSSSRSTSVDVEFNESDPMVEILLDHYDEWQGTPYRLGGTNKKGVDCSAYVQNISRQYFKGHLSRTTLTQSKQGKHVNRSALEPGDLVFFKIKGKTRHVGIYMGEGHFLHASTSRGVVISNLYSDYWKKYYWMSRRVEL
ncbi:NlpC/P60 family protein [Motilimonas pumila]|uniref:Glycoside hydrolase n=1 Tax=Motilimonas pumila TaxID=2303987 RepID=A0A418Y9X7_9GAMM|nr:NlpC/P60 family protein [Motilimonas pumila]RJG38611.1 glycoside hydrolase [Motilimonas pumila]